MKTPEGLTEPFEQYRIIDDEIFQRASDKLSSRDPNKEAERSGAQRIPKGNRGLLNGIIYCAHCGGRLCFNHYSQKRRLADGTLRVYERNVYRCYTRLYNNNGCPGRVSYKADVIEANILMIVHRYFASIRKMPTATILKKAMVADTSLLTQAYQQAKKALEKAQNEMVKLQEEAIKVLTGESTYTSQLISQPLPLQEEKLAKAQEKFDQYSQELCEEKQREKEHQREIDEIRTWADIFDEASFDQKRQIIAAIIRKVIVADDNKVEVQLHFSADQYFTGTMPRSVG